MFFNYAQFDYRILAFLALIKCGSTIIDLDTSEDLDSIFLKDVTVLESKSVSAMCEKQINSLDYSTLLSMIDASGKIPIAVLGGNRYNLGDFDECVNIKSDVIDPPIYGKYCLGTIPLPDVIARPNRTIMITVTQQPTVLGPQDTVGIHMGICVPNACSSDVFSIISNYTEQYCYDKSLDSGFSGQGIAAITVLIAFVGFVILSSAVDGLSRYKDIELPHQALVAFSILINGPKLFRTSHDDPDQMPCLHGLRAYSMMWVLLAHSFALSVYSMASNFKEIEDFYIDPPVYNMIMINASLATDTFLVISGLLNTINFLKMTDKGKKFNIFLFYLHRILRLTPLLGIVILIHALLLEDLGSGPIWNLVGQVLGRPCRDHWWNTLLYIQNITRESSCIPQSWYLAVDMQLFLLSPLVLWPLIKWSKSKRSLWPMYILSIIGLVVLFVVGYVLELDAYAQTEEYNYYYYMATHTRYVPYVFGMITGYHIHHFRKSGNKLKLSPVLLSLLWFFSLGGLLAAVLVGYPVYLNRVDRIGHTLYLVLDRPVWALMVCVLIFLCTGGRGGPINSFLGHGVHVFLAKISYPMYLMHFAVISVRLQSMKTVYRFSAGHTLITYWGDLITTVIVSVLLHLIFESPILAMEKIILDRRKSTKTEENNVENETQLELQENNHTPTS